MIIFRSVDVIMMKSTKSFLSSLLGSVKILPTKKVENQNPAKIELTPAMLYCKTHSLRKIKGYCNDCKKFFCKECMEEHIEHNAEKLKNFCEKRKNDILNQVTTWDLAVQLEERRGAMIGRSDILAREHNDAIRRITITENKDTMYNKELEYLDGIFQYLLNVEEKASTITLKSGCEEALKHLDLTDKIREEFETMSKDIESTRARAKELERELQELTESVNTLTYLKGENGKYEFNDNKWAAFLLLNEMTSLFKTNYCINTTVDNFIAFPFVEMALDIDGVLKQNFVDVGKEVKVSEPIKVEKGLMGGDWICASLSHQGILAVYVHNPSVVQFTDLKTNRQVKIDVEDYSLVGFYDNMILLLT